jgi:hypothetical protein
MFIWTDPLHNQSTPLSSKNKIQCGKCNIKSAYWRIILNGLAAAQRTMMCEQFGCFSLRLTFGDPPPVVVNGVFFEESCTDLANDLLHSMEWDHTMLCSPYTSKLSPPSYLNDDIPFTQAEDLDVDI